MVNLKKAWVRIVISFLVGGAISETAYIMSDKEQRPESEHSLLYAVGVYILLTITVYLMYRKRETSK